MLRATSQTTDMGLTARPTFVRSPSWMTLIVTDMFGGYRLARKDVALAHMTEQLLHQAWPVLQCTPNLSNKCKLWHGVSARRPAPARRLPAARRRPPFVRAPGPLGPSGPPGPDGPMVVPHVVCETFRVEGSLLFAVGGRGGIGSNRGYVGTPYIYIYIYIYIHHNRVGA